MSESFTHMGQNTSFTYTCGDRARGTHAPIGKAEAPLTSWKASSTLKTGLMTFKPKCPATAWGIGNAPRDLEMTKRRSNDGAGTDHPETSRIGDEARRRTPSKTMGLPIGIGKAARARTARLRIGAGRQSSANDHDVAHIRDAPSSLTGTGHHCTSKPKARGLCCDNPGAKPKIMVFRAMTNIPEKLPVIQAEIDLLQTYWGAILDVIAANDNDPD